MNCENNQNHIKVQTNNTEIDINQMIRPCNQCVFTLGRCVVVPIPHGFVWSKGSASVVPSPDLSCCLTECTARTTVCGSTSPIEVGLIEVRLTGIIQYVVNIPVMAQDLSGRCTGDLTYISLSDSLKVDNVVCHLMAGTEFTCPTDPARICNVTATVQDTSGDLSCGDAPLRGVRVDIRFTLPNNICSTP